MPRFQNPVNGHIVHVDTTMVWLGALLFGPIFFLCIGEIGHGLANFLLGLVLWAVFLGWIVWIVWAIAAPGIVRQKWLSKGYREMDAAEPSNYRGPSNKASWRSIRDSSSRARFNQSSQD